MKRKPVRIEAAVESILRQNPFEGTPLGASPRYLLIPPGRALLWALPPASTPTDSWDLRGISLYRQSLPGLPPPRDTLREVTVLEAMALPPGGLTALLEAVEGAKEGAEGGAEGAGERPLIRLACPIRAFDPCGIEGAAKPGVADEAAGINRSRPLFLQLQLSTMTAPEERALREPLASLADKGLPLAAEVLLEKGVNDDINTLRKMLPALVRLRVRPYYLLTGPWLPSGRRLPEQKALQLARALRGWISGLAVPQLVQENGQGERRLLIPDYIAKMEENRTELVNYRGDKYTHA